MNNMSSSSSSSGDKFFDDFLEDITRCLTKDESKQQQIRDNMKAKFMAEDSVRIYNQSQDQLYCHPSSESHPDSWRISSPADCENKGCVHHYCSSSSSSSSTSSSLSTSGKRKDSEGKRSSEATLKLAAINRSFFTVAQPEIICPANCSMNGNCIKAVNMLDVRSEIVWFWGELNATTTQSTSERRRKIIDKMRKSIFKSIGVKNKKNGEEGGLVHKFVFSVGSSEVCETAYLHIIGHGATKMWLKCKKELLSSYSRNNGLITEVELKDLDAAIKMTKSNSEMRTRKKSDHALSFLQYLTKFYASLSPNEGEENLRVLPFETYSALFTEYKAYCETNDVDTSMRARKETFRLVWKEFYSNGNVKLSRGKGTFPTCDICNNANDMLSLSKSKTWTKKQRDIIISFKVII